MRTSYKTLTDNEYNVLQVISSRTKNDCWFWLKQDKDGTDYVWDLEEGKRRCLKTGVTWLVEGIDCQENYDNCWLNAFEDLAFRGLLKKLNIEFDVPYNGPSIIGVEYKTYDAHFKQYFTDRVFIKANSEAEALKYFNEHFSNRGQATKTYFAAGIRCDADATIEAKEASLSDKIAEAKAQGSVSDKEPEQADFSRLER